MADRLECDIIMRGGITSGLVYPGAIATLAEKYDFKQIGGASAGAIAAGITAAAQFGRNRDPDVFESVIRTIPTELGAAVGGKSGLERLFTPIAPLQPLLALALEAKAKADLGVAKKAIVKGLLAPLWQPAALAAALIGLAGAALAAGLLYRGGLLAGWNPLLMAGLMLLVAAGIGFPLFALLLWRRGTALAARAQALHDRFVANGFGLTGGVNRALPADATIDRMQREGHLSDWLNAMIQKAAGLPKDEPLTMGHLWGGSPDAGPWEGKRAIDLILTTTNLSQQLPHSFPFLERVASLLYFRAEDLGGILPPPVLAWMVAHAAPGWTLERDGATYLRLPPARLLPVLLGVRMSLSFPGLVAAVRLYETCRWDPKRDKDGRDRAAAAKSLRSCWFSDGGITSNFPVTAFDAPLPNRPTFCINLADLGPGDRAGDTPEERVRMPKTNSDMIRAPHLSWIEEGGIPAFVSAIVSAARNGQENALQTVPGQRDRIATVHLNPKAEGGLNLAMPEKTINQLSAYGDAVGAKFVARFHPDGGGDPKAAGMTWANHRWLRFRSAMAGLETLLVRFDRNFSAQHPRQPGYAQLLSKSRVRGEGYDWGRRDAKDNGVRQAQAIARFAESFAAAPLTDWTKPGTAARPAGSIFNGRRAAPADTDSLSREHNAPMPPMAWQLAPVSRDPWKC